MFFVSYLGVAVIDDKLASAFLEDNTSDGTFSPASADDSLGGEPTRKPRLHVLL